MIKALNIATQGLIQAERRATDIAQDILKTASSSASFTPTDRTKTVTNPTQSQEETKAMPSTGPTKSVALQGDYGGLIQQFADLRAEEAAFKASATAFKKIDEALGTLLDDEG